MGTVYTDYAGLPVPDENSADDIPSWLGQLAARLDTTTVLYATSTSDRDARYYQAPSGIICVIREAADPYTVDAVYIKTSGAGTSVWSPIWTAPASSVWVDVQLVAGYVSRQVGTSDPQIRMENSEFAVMKGGISRDDGSAIPGATVVGYLPQGFTVPRALDLPVASNTNVLGTTGSETLKLSISPTTGSLTFYGAANLTWIGFDSVRFSTIY